MYKYSIIINSSADLTEEVRKELDLVLAPLKFTIEGTEYINYLDYRSLDVKDFYEQMRSGKVATTSQLNVSEYVELIKKNLTKEKMF